jgi:hypothetical protein
MKVPTVLTGVLAAGALGFGVLGLAAPSRLARLVGSDEETARELGVRDLGNGLVILAAPSAGLAQRAFYDLSDAVLFGRRKPKVGVGALAFAALGVYTLAAR